MFSALFDEVAEVVRGGTPDELGPLRCRAHSGGVKVWFGEAKPPREHYEAQLLGVRDVPWVTVLALEIGFHCEHPDPARNQSVLDGLVRAEATWRPQLGPDAEAAPFLGRLTDWRRLSEVWPDPDLSPGDVALEIGARLVDYLVVLEPLRRAGGEVTGPTGRGARRRPAGSPPRPR
jgi:hypothetical protein